MTITPLDLDTLTLGKGAHDNQCDGMCIEEARTVWHGWEWGDSPANDSPVIAAFLRSWNDSLDDEDRQQLKRYVTIPSTAASPAVDEARAWMALDWLVRTYTPAWLRLAGLVEQADRLVGLPEFRAGMDVPSIRPTIDAVRKDAAAARAAAWDVVWAAAWDAAGAAAWAAAGAAAGDAARDVVWAAAWDAAGAAAWDAAGAAAWDAAGDAAGAALRPTTIELQQSAHDLLTRMIEAS